MLTRRNIKYKSSRIVRIIVKFNNTNISRGTGFFISAQGLLLTCAHVILGKEFTYVQQDKEFIDAQGTNNIEKVENYQKLLTNNIQIQLEDGTLKEVLLKKINPDYDIASLQVVGDDFSCLYFNIETRNEPYLGEEVSFYGFPDVLGHTPTNSPFVVNTSIISTFPNATIAGSEYRHMQINATTIGGISGAPIFKGNSNTVLGLINGNFNWDFPNIVSCNQGKESLLSRKVISAIGYATSMKLLNDNTAIFSN